MALNTFNPKRFQRLLYQHPLLTTNKFIVNIRASVSSVNNEATESASQVIKLLKHYSSNEQELLGLSVGSVSSPVLNFSTDNTRILGHSYYTASGFSNNTVSLNNILNSGPQFQFFNALAALIYSQKKGTYGYPVDYFVDIFVNDYNREGVLVQEHKFQNCVLTNLQGPQWSQADQNTVQNFSCTFNYFRYTPVFYDI